MQGFTPKIIYPKEGKGELFMRLVKQCLKSDIPISSEIVSIEGYNLVVDALFGFSYKPPVREQFKGILSLLSNCEIPVVSVDIPSGWIVDEGPPGDGSTPVIKPDCLISLTAPKLCARKFQGTSHYLGGRFIPQSLENKYDLKLPIYNGTDCCVKLPK